MDNLTIGIDIGGTRTKYGLVDITNGYLLETAIHPTEKKNESAFFEQANTAVSQLRSRALQLGRTVTGIGVGVSSFVHANGIVDSTYGFQEFLEDYPLRSRLEDKFNLPVRIDNDARAVALGEALYGKGKNIQRVLSLTLGTGLGFGFVVNGRFPDALALSHMAGHIVIADSDVRCYCGKTGCLESLVSSFGIINAAKKFGWQGDSSHSSFSEEIFSKAKEANMIARDIVNHMLLHLQTGIQNYVNLFAPDIIILGGGIAQGLIPFADRLAVNPYLKPYKNYQFQIAISELGEKAGIMGSAALMSLPS